MRRTVEVALGARSYAIEIGSGMDEVLTAFVRGAGYSARGMIVTDTNVGPRYAAHTRAAAWRLRSSPSPPGSPRRALP